MSNDRPLPTFSAADEALVKEMMARLKAMPVNEGAIAAAQARAQKRHESVVALGLKCPKPMKCAICDASRTAAVKASK